VGLDPRHVGRRYPPTEPYRVSREKVREFATAIGDDNRLYVDPEAARRAGHPDIIAPPTFAVVVSLPATKAASLDPELGIDYSRVVHGEQCFRHERSLHAGDRVVATVEIAAIGRAGVNDSLTTRTELRVGDELVCTAVSTLVIRAAELP
jgi:acyl dehydratase